MLHPDDDDDVALDPRHVRRITLVQQLYAQTFGEAHLDEHVEPTIRDEFEVILSQLDAIDAHIQKHAPKYPLDQVAKADLAILRLSTYELLFNKKEPTKVIINEAVDLAREMGSERSYAFVNAVLGSMLEAQHSSPPQE